MNIIAKILRGGSKISSYLFLGFLVLCTTFTANAADITTWIDDPANRGTEAEPINLYDATKWESRELPSDNYNINFIAEGRTYVTNGTPNSTMKIARSLGFLCGDFVVFGPMKSASYGAALPETGSVSVDKRGDWVVEASVYAASGDGVHLAFTNRTGNLEICNGGPARIGCANNSEVSFVLEGGSVTGVSSDKNMSLGYESGSKGYFVQNGGTASIAGKLLLGYYGYGELTINDGTFTVGDQVIFSDGGADSSGKLTLNGGVLETPYISCGNGKGGTITFNGGTLKAASSTKDRFIKGDSKIKVRIGEGGGTIDTAGLWVDYSKEINPLEGVTNDGGLAIVGGGVLNIIQGYKRFMYNGKTKIELGTRLILPVEQVGGGVEFTVPEGLAPAVYNPLTSTGDFTLENIFKNAVFPDDPNAEFVLSSDKKKILCYYKLEGIQDPIWHGAVSQDLGNGKNWSTETVPEGGICYIGVGDYSGPLVSSASFSPDSITYTEGSRSITINGSDDISGITAITNLSAVNHTNNVPVRFADKIRVQQGAMAWGSRNEPQVVFAGGAYGTSIDDSYSRFVSGHYILSDDKVQFVANSSEDAFRYGILAGSSLTVPRAANLTHFLNGMGGGMGTETGGAFTAGVHRVEGTSVCRYNQGRSAEFVVTNELFVSLTSDIYLAYRKADGWFKFEKVTIGDSSKDKTFYFSINGGSETKYYCDKFVRVGRGGFNFEEGLEKNPLFQFGTTNLETVTITPWYSDFTIGTKGRANKADVMFGSKTIFDTTDENGIGRAITINALCDGTNDVNVVGKGAVVVNNSANKCSGAVSVSGGATLALNAGCPFGTGAVTVKNATLKADSSGYVIFPNSVVCQADATLAFNFSEKGPAPCLAFKSTAENAMPAALNIRLSAAEGVNPSRCRHTLTLGYDFTDTELTLIDPPKWVRSIGKDENGNIVLDVKTNGTLIILR